MFFIFFMCKRLKSTGRTCGQELEGSAKLRAFAGIKTPAMVQSGKQRGEEEDEVCTDLCTLLCGHTAYAFVDKRMVSLSCTLLGGTHEDTEVDGFSKQVSRLCRFNLWSFCFLPFSLCDDFFSLREIAFSFCYLHRMSPSLFAAQSHGEYVICAALSSSAFSTVQSRTKVGSQVCRAHTAHDSFYSLSPFPSLPVTILSNHVPVSLSVP